MKALVKRYKQSVQGVDGKLRDQLIMDYAPLIRFVAQRVASRLPANIDLDDLISAGVIGLIDAIEKYDPSRDNKFKTYAEFRIRGAILDELRAQDWIPRSVRDKAKRIERAFLSLEQKFGRPATEEEVCAELEMTLGSYQSMLAKVKSVALLSLDDLSGPNQSERLGLLECLENLNSKNPYAQLKNKNIKNIIVKGIESLPDKQKLVLSLYYYEDLNLKEIGKILEVTESRVSQLHTQGIINLKVTLEEEVME